MNVISLPIVIAQTAQPTQNLLVQLFPFAMMLGIFYLLVLMPMRKRQKKVAQFQFPEVTQRVIVNRQRSGNSDRQRACLAQFWDGFSVANKHIPRRFRGSGFASVQSHDCTP